MGHPRKLSGTGLARWRIVNGVGGGRNDCVAAVRRYTTESEHCDGSGKLQVVPGDWVEDGGARGRRGVARGGLRLRDGGTRGAGDGARAGAEAVRALRFRELCDGSGGRKNLDGTAGAVVEAGQAGGAGICSRLSGVERKGIAVDGELRRGEDSFGRGGIERVDPAGAFGIILRLSRIAERDPGELQRGERIDGDGDSGAGTDCGNSCDGRRWGKQAFGVGAGYHRIGAERAV